MSRPKTLRRAFTRGEVRRVIVAHADTQAPRALDSADARAAHERARAFFERPAKERSQESFLFDDTPLADPSVRSALWGACTGKCAYCEAPLTEQAMLVDRFRPASGALALDGSLSPDHYWWLAYAWENLYPSCAECQSFKGSRFPGPRKPGRARDDRGGAAGRATTPARAASRRSGAAPRLHGGRLRRLDDRRRGARRSRSSDSTVPSSSPPASRRSPR